MWWLTSFQFTLCNRDLTFSLTFFCFVSRLIGNVIKRFTCLKVRSHFIWIQFSLWSRDNWINFFFSPTAQPTSPGILSVFLSFIVKSCLFQPKHAAVLAWRALFDKAAEVAAGCTTRPWLKQETGLGCPSSQPFDLQTESCRPVYCTFPPEWGINFYKRCFSLMTCETAIAKRKKEEIGKTSGCVHWLQNRQPALLALCGSMLSTSEGKHWQTILSHTPSLS